MSDDDQPICIGCGLCCDGTLFHAVDLDSSDDLGFLLSNGALIVTDAGSRRLQQPCPSFDGACCGIYESRPTTCRSFSCALLSAVSSGETPHSDARSIIERARELTERVRATFEPADDDGANHLGSPGLSTYLGIMENDYDRDRLQRVVPEVVELIDLLRSSFGWSNQVHPTAQLDPGK